LAFSFTGLAGTWSWNSFNDFWINVPATGGDGDYPLTTWVANGGSTNANAWNYAGGNLTGGAFPTQVGAYLGGGFRYGLTAGNTYASDGQSYTFGANDLGITNYYIGYNMTVWPDVQVGKYNYIWDYTVPGWSGSPDTNNTYLWLKGQNHGMPANDNSAAMLEWMAPYSGNFDFSATFIPGNYGGFNCCYAIVDSSGSNYVSRQVVAQGSAAQTFNFNVTLTASQVVQFQVGAPDGESCPVGVSVLVTNIYVNPSLMLGSTTPAFVGRPVTLSATVSPAPDGGTVQFYNNSSLLGSPVAVNTNTGLAQLTTSTIPVGTNVITASYSGAGRCYAASNTSGVTQIIGAVLSTATALNVPLPNPSDFGQAVTLTATVFPAPNAGTVQFYDNSSPLNSAVTVNTNTGVAQCITSILAPGSHLITATFSGAPGYSSSAASAVTANVGQWNAFTDFWINVPGTDDGGDYPLTVWMANGGSTNANAWNYAAGNLTGGSFPSSVGTYLDGGSRYGLTAGNTYAAAGQSFTFGPGNYYIGYNMTVWPDIQVAKYNYIWDSTVPGWSGAAGPNSSYLWVRPQFHGIADTDSSAALLEWTAPHSGAFSFVASFLPGDFQSIGGTTVSYAVVDSGGTVWVARQEVAQGSAVQTFHFSATLTNGQTVQFQVGAPTTAACPVGVSVLVSGLSGASRITGVAPGNPTAVTAQGVSTYKYVLQRATALTSPAWVNVTTNQADSLGQVIALDYFSDLGGSSPPKAFYRFLWQP
jgi:hypothetical protein